MMYICSRIKAEVKGKKGRRERERERERETHCVKFEFGFVMRRCGQPELGAGIKN